MIFFSFLDSIWTDNTLKFSFMLDNIGIMLSPLQLVIKLKSSNVHETLGLCPRNVSIIIIKKFQI